MIIVIGSEKTGFCHLSWPSSSLKVIDWLQSSFGIKGIIDSQLPCKEVLYRSTRYKPL